MSGRDGKLDMSPLARVAACLAHRVHSDAKHAAQLRNRQLSSGTPEEGDGGYEARQCTAGVTIGAS